MVKANPVEFARTFRFLMKADKMMFGVCAVSEIYKVDGKWLPITIESGIYRSKEKDSILMELFAIAEEIVDGMLETAKQRTYDIEMIDTDNDGKPIVIYALDKCEVLEYKLSKHDAMNDGIMIETMIVQPKDVRAKRP